VRVCFTGGPFAGVRFAPVFRRGSFVRRYDARGLYLTMNERDNMAIVNTSGFPFQMRVAQAIRDNPGRHGWRLLAEEHPWKHPASGESGFIDLIAGFGAVRLVAECKRGADSTWLFLMKKADRKTGDIAEVLCTDSQTGKPDLCEWCRMRIQPASPIASFCIVRGQGEKEPMLERIASTLLRSTEALGNEELQLARDRSFGNYQFYIPTIITTAQLVICRIDPNDVDMKDGKIDVTRADYEDVDSLRFRKAFGVPDRYTASESLEETHIESLRTVVVVSASRLTDFLDKMDLKQESDWSGWPQNIMRAKEQRK
jgi:hypothetical protein